MATSPVSLPAPFPPRSEYSEQGMVELSMITEEIVKDVMIVWGSTMPEAARVMLARLPPAVHTDCKTSYQIGSNWAKGMEIEWQRTTDENARLKRYVAHLLSKTGTSLTDSLVPESSMDERCISPHDPAWCDPEEMPLTADELLDFCGKDIDLFCDEILNDS